MDESAIPPTLRGTFLQMKEDFMLNLESDAHDLAVERGMVKEVVGEMPIADPGAKKEIMKVLLTDPNYLQWALESLLESCKSKGLNPIDCQVFIDVIRSLVRDGKIKLPF